MSLGALFLATTLVASGAQPADPHAAVPPPASEPATEPAASQPAEAEPTAEAPPAEAQPAEKASAPPEPERTAKNLIFLEGFGSGLLYSVSYERIIDSLNLGLRIGVSYFTYPVSSYGQSGNLTLFTLPIMASYYVGWETHKIQLGLGATMIATDAATDSQGTSFGGERSGVGIAASGYIGYRYLPLDHGITFGLGFSPLLRGSKALPWGGANFGYVF